jgi:hypothetical protein
MEACFLQGEAEPKKAANHEGQPHVRLPLTKRHRRFFGPSGPSRGWSFRQPLISTARFFTSGTGIAGISISRTPFLNVALAFSAFT